MGFPRKRRHKKTDRALAAALADAEFQLKDDLVAARKAAGLDQKDVAEIMGVDKSTVSRFERLDSNPTLSMIRYYAHAVGVLVHYKVDPGTTAETPEPAATPPSLGQWYVTHMSEVIPVLHEQFSEGVPVREIVAEFGSGFSRPALGTQASGDARTLVPVVIQALQ
ncbi:helix-turn-helix domain-containing protein [Nocardia sp. NPDC003482]